jgi:hypothetical protein
LANLRQLWATDFGCLALPAGGVKQIRLMNLYDSRRWISRKELALVIGRSYASMANSESFLGLDKIRLRINSRMIVFPEAAGA